MTTREYFEAVINYIDGDESEDGVALREKSIELILKLDEKNKRLSPADIKKKQEAAARREAVLEYLVNADFYTGREEIATALGLTPGSVTAACTILVKDGAITKKIETINHKRQTIYSGVPTKLLRKAKNKEEIEE